MIIFEVAARRTADPAGKAGMLPRGHRIVLDPETFEKHADLTAKLRKSRAWREVSESKAQIPQAPSLPPSDGLLPHQRQVLDRLRAATR